MSQTHAYIHPDAKLAPTVIVDPFSVIHEDVEIGEGTWIGSNVTIFPGARIGRNCRIFPGAVIAAIPQDLKFKGEKTAAIIGDGSTIRECATINRGTTDKGRTEVGRNCLIMAYCHIAHDCILEDNVIMSNGVQMAGHVSIGRHATIGGTAAIHQFVKIGAHTMVGGGTLVRKDVPPFVTAAREPLSFAGVNSIGLRRRGYTEVQINQIQECYRYIYQRGFNISDALAQIELNLPASAERDEIVLFIKNAERGIIKG
jgi:UDP-N-acetylglucosamine acyltransferase